MDFGFHLSCSGIPNSRISRNHKSALDHLSVIQELIRSVLEAGRIAWPFPLPPLSQFVSSPVGVAPKSEPGKFRVIHNLSSPKHNSVNLFIPEENSNLNKHDSLDVATDLLRKFGSVALMSKTDILDTFRNIPIHPNVYKVFLGTIIFTIISIFLWVLIKSLSALVPFYSGQCVNKFQQRVCPILVDILFHTGLKDSSKCIADLEFFCLFVENRVYLLKRRKQYLSQLS